MSKKTPGTSKTVWQEMDKFSEKVLQGEYASSSDHDTDALLAVEGGSGEAKPINESGEEIGKLEGEVSKLSISSTNNEGDEDDEEDYVDSSSDEDDYYEGESYTFVPNLPTIVEEEQENAQCSKVSSSEDDASEDDSSDDDQYDGATFSGKNEEDNSFPLPLDICFYLEERCIETKRFYSKYVPEEERQQIKMVYSGSMSSVLVCQSAATLHLCTKSQIWMEHFYGIPMLLLESQGPIKKIWLYLIERSSGVLLWKNYIDWRAAYTRDNSTFHSMNLINSKCEKMGLDFDCETGASEFWLHITKLLTLLQTLTAPETPGDTALTSFYEHLTSMSHDECRHFFATRSSPLNPSLI